MEKNYNIDDILLDIKSKKSRQREQAAQRSAQDAAPPPPPPQPGEKPAAPWEEVTQAKEPPAWEAQPEAPPAVERVPDPPDPEEADPPQAAGEPDPGDEGEYAFSQVEEHKPNPLRFDGHVQSITDRARMRQGRFGRVAQQRQQAEDTAVIDFSAFKAGVEEQIASEEAQDDEGHTRVLPKLGGDLEALRNRQPTVLGISEDDDDEYVIYEGDDDEDDDYEEDDQLPRPAVDFSEYNSVEDRRDVAIDIARVKLWLVIRLLVTALLTGILFYLALSAKYMDMPLPAFLAPERELRNYLLTLTVLSALTALAGSSAMGGGLLSLLKMRANSDTLAALAMLGAVGQCIYATVSHESGLVRPEELTLYCCVAALSMFFNALGKTSMISRIQANFKIISSGRSKKAVLLAEDEAFCRHFVRGTVRRPPVAVAAKTDFFTDFLALSYSDKYDVGIHKVVAPICLAGAFVVGILTYILTQDMLSAVTALTGILCVASTFSATFIENIPLGKLTKKLAPRGGMVSGNKAVEDFCDVAALVLSDSDLFPGGNIQIHGIKAFEGGRVDEAILDVASIVCTTDSSMSSVFLGMIGGNRKLLKPVENVSYEYGRGVVAWVDGRRVLMGNLNLMQAYGITMPEQSFEGKYSQDGVEIFYLAVGGDAAARFLVSYRIDDQLAVELDRLAALEKQLIVYTLDPNMDEQKIWSLYGYPEKLIKIIPGELHDKYHELTRPRPQALAEIAYTGRASAMAGAILACITARSSILAATMVQLIQIALGYGLVTLLAFMGAIPTLTVLVLAAYQFFWFVVIWLIQKLKAA